MIGLLKHYKFGYVFFEIGKYCAVNESNENLINPHLLISLPTQEKADDPRLALSQAIILQADQVIPDKPRPAA